jgi:CHAT domain-containing protein/Tfp pilus assembly protein PilF
VLPCVIPAKLVPARFKPEAAGRPRAGIQRDSDLLDAGFRRHDDTASLWGTTLVADCMEGMMGTPAWAFRRLLCALFLVGLLVPPASAQEALKEANELNQQVMKLYQAGKYAEAIPLAQRMLAITEQILGPTHPAVAQSLNNLAMLYKETGQYAKAEPLYQRSLAIKEKALGPIHPAVAAGLNNLAGLYQTTGQYAKAEPLYQRSLAIAEQALGPAHPDVATSLNNLAALYRTMGQYAKAEPLYQRSLAIREQTLGPTHPDIAVSLNNLALLYQTTGEYAKAEPLYERSLATYEQILGPAHPAVGQSLNNLALLYVTMGQYAKAEPLYQRSLAIREQALGPTHPDVAQSLNNLAELYRATGQYEKAEPLYRHSLAIYEQALGPAHPDVALSLANLAGLEAALHHNGQALDHFTRSLRIEDRHIQEVFSFTAEEQQLAFIESIKWPSLAFLSFIHQRFSTDRRALREGLDLVLRRKGLVFDAQARTQQVLRGRMSADARQEFDRLSDARSRLAQLLLNRPQAMTAEEYRARQAALREQIERSESRLAKASAVIAKELKRRTVTVEAVAAQLPPRGALVEFVKIRDVDFMKGEWKGWRYLAFVLAASGEVRLVDLGDADALERRITDTLAQVRGALDARGAVVPERAARTTRALQDLYARLWAPLEGALGSADRVVLSPDGALNFVPFAALTAPDGRLLIERYRPAYVTGGRDLIGVDDAAMPPESDLVLAANPAFGGALSASSGGDGAPRSRDFGGQFQPLPGTEREAAEIPPLVADRTGRKLVLHGERATETAVKQTRSPRILHLATHGFFLADEAQDLPADARGGFFARDLAVHGRAPARRPENPLVRSGLALAGANHAAEITEGDDGILTALEITGMDLYGTELVVLSACNTGVGEVKNGEGVFGLRRAFALAGAQTLLMSLWPVGDEVTADQMKAFYKNLHRLPPADALREAQLETIAALRARYHGEAPVELWAPFILQGGRALGQ